MKKFLSVILTLAMLLGFGAIFAFACDTAECEVDACDCVCATCDGVDCECLCHEAEGDDDTDVKLLSGYELWYLKLTTGKLGAALQKLAGWGDWVLKILYYVCFGWLYNIVVDINITVG